MKIVEKYPFVCYDTKEMIPSYEEYLMSKHWNILKKQYLSSNLSKTCQKCGKSDIPYDFKHKIFKRIGNEYLTDIIPLCTICYPIEANSNWIFRKGKKKIVRLQLKAFSFNPLRTSEKDLQMFLSIKPALRGYTLSKYFSDKLNGKASSQWINQQVSHVSKWIKKELKNKQKENNLLINFLENNKKWYNIDTENVMGENKHE